MTQSLNLVFCGTPRFAVPTLEKLASAGVRIHLVVTQPDRPKGRGRRTQSPPAAEVAAELGIEVLQTSTVNDDEPLERIRALRPDRLQA